MKVQDLKLRMSSFSIPTEEWDKLTEEQQNAMALAAFATDEEMGTAIEVEWPTEK